MNSIATTRRLVSELSNEIETKMEILTFECEDQEVFETLEEATQNVLSILNSLKSDLAYINLNKED